VAYPGYTTRPLTIIGILDYTLQAWLPERARADLCALPGGL
jgi:hypothetical protein